MLTSLDLCLNPSTYAGIDCMFALYLPPVTICGNTPGFGLLRQEVKVIKGTHQCTNPAQSSQVFHKQGQHP